jgi:scyllo-inositol 2-dehydrogenase (NAD+)
VASTREDRAAEVARALGVRASGYDALIQADDVDAVVVAARSVDHAAVGARVLAAGKHLFLEKPGATSLVDHDLLLTEARRRPEAIVHVGYHRRFDAGFVELHRLVAAGAVGEPLLVLSTSRDRRTPEPEDPRPAGGFLVDMACHDYDAACWLLGQEPVEAHAARQALVYPELAPAGDLDNAVVTIRFDAGGIATTHVSRTCAYGHDIRAEVVGTEGSAFLGNASSRDGVTVVTGTDAASFPLDYRERFSSAYREELAAFAAVCAGEERPLPGLEDDRRAVAVGVAARSSAVAGVARATGVDWPFEPAG